MKVIANSRRIVNHISFTATCALYLKLFGLSYVLSFLRPITQLPVCVYQIQYLLVRLTDKLYDSSAEAFAQRRESREITLRSFYLMIPTQKKMKHEKIKRNRV